MKVRKILGVSALLFTVIIALGQGCSRFQLSSADIKIQASTLGPACQKPSGINGSPKTIEETVALINALPRPVTINCFLEVLDRPLKVSLTNNTLSAQPALGSRSPRVFILNNPLILSVVPEGPDREKLELSYLLSSAESIKAEIAFPITDNIAPSAPYERIRYQSGTACASCHLNERAANGITFATAFISKAYQPKANTKVSLTSFQQELGVCNSASEPDRCAMLRSLLSHGEVQNQDFPSDMATFF